MKLSIDCPREFCKSSKNPPGVGNGISGGAPGIGPGACTARYWLRLPGEIGTISSVVMDEFCVSKPLLLELREMLGEGIVQFLIRSRLSCSLLPLRVSRLSAQHSALRFDVVELLRALIREHL